MTAAAFDTLTAARDLETAGMGRPQAEAVAAAIRAGQGDLATRADLRAEIAGIDARIAGIDTRIVSLEARIYRAMLFQAFAIAGAVIAAIKLIP